MNKTLECPHCGSLKTVATQNYTTMKVGGGTAMIMECPSCGKGWELVKYFVLLKKQSGETHKDCFSDDFDYCLSNDKYCSEKGKGSLRKKMKKQFSLFSKGSK